MSLCCPDCATPVLCKPGAREGRCVACRPQPSRRHSQPRQLTPNQGLAALVLDINRTNYTQ